MDTTVEDLTPGVALARANQHPVAVYLAGLAEGPGRDAMQSTLRQVEDSF